MSASNPVSGMSLWTCLRSCFMFLRVTVTNTKRSSQKTSLLCNGLMPRSQPFVCVGQLYFSIPKNMRLPESLLALSILCPCSPAACLCVQYQGLLWVLSPTAASSGCHIVSACRGRQTWHQGSSITQTLDSQQGDDENAANISVFLFVWKP